MTSQPNIPQPCLMNIELFWVCRALQSVYRAFLVCTGLFECEQGLFRVNRGLFSVNRTFWVWTGLLSVHKALLSIHSAFWECAGCLGGYRALLSVYRAFCVCTGLFECTLVFLSVYWALPSTTPLGGIKRKREGEVEGERERVSVCMHCVFEFLWFFWKRIGVFKRPT